MKNNTDYLYYRSLYSNYYYVNKYFIEITLYNGEKRYLYFNSLKQIRFTRDEKFATKFSRKPKNFDKYVEYIHRKYPGSRVQLADYVVLKSKY